MLIDINKLQVEPVYDYFDRQDVETVLSRGLSYVASYREEWVAVLLFDKAVDRNKLRKSEICWSSEQEKQRRSHIANNSRFAILPAYEQIANLASKILSLVSSQI